LQYHTGLISLLDEITVFGLSVLGDDFYTFVLLHLPITSKK
jgi:hypothetical protein